MRESSAQVQEASSTGPQNPMRGVRLLSFDGGGYRGISSLVILHEIMARIKFNERLPEDPLPCNYFDLIGGTSTGGLIAIMLGRLRMSVPEAIKQYTLLAQNVFPETMFKFLQQRTLNVNAHTLESGIKDIIRSSSCSCDDGRMLDPRPANDVCKTYVCAMPASGMAASRLFRTYHVADDASAECFIWEAVHAAYTPTSNNPVSQLIYEAGRVFNGRRPACIVSIGTGHAETTGLRSPNVFQRLLPTDLIGVLRKTTSNCETVEEAAERVAKQYMSLPGIYFRFNVEDLQQVSLSEWHEFATVLQHTKQYLEKVTFTQNMEQLVQVVQARVR